MKFTILIYETPEQFAARTDPKTPEYMGAYAAYNQALAEANVFAGGAGLQPPATGTTVRVRKGERSVQDGPFADAKEQLGGYYVIDVPNLDKALEWAARCPGASNCAVEVRPHLEMPQK